MARTTKDLLRRVETITSAWERKRPGKKFSGFTVAEMQKAAQLCRDVRSELKLHEDLFRGSQKRRDLLDADLAEMVRRVVLSVRGDDEDGDDSALFGEMGFVPRSRRTRRARRRVGAAAEAAAAPTTAAALASAPGLAAVAAQVPKPASLQAPVPVPDKAA